MTRQKMNKIETIAAQRQRRAHYQQGEGLYEYRNTTTGTLGLPKPIMVNGQECKEIPYRGTWQGDNYFMLLVKGGMAALVRTINDPNQKEEVKMEEKLILDQPDVTTQQGVIEQVIVTDQKKVKPVKPKPTKLEENNEVLLNDDAMDGVQILG